MARSMWTTALERHVEVIGSKERARVLPGSEAGVQEVDKALVVLNDVRAVTTTPDLWVPRTIGLA